MADQQQHRSEKDKTAGQAAKEAAKDAREDVAEDVESYERDLLIRGGLTDYEPHIVAGALAGLPASPKSLSIEEANAACKAWLESPVEAPKEA